ncbi:MAG: helix-turn-helix domain-containing protein, partial [Spirochaeta sp.]
LPPSITENDDAEVVRVPLGSSLDEVERQVIEATLLANKGNKSRTAEVLGIGRKTLHRKIHEFGIED